MRSARKGAGVLPSFKRVDTCAAEFEAQTPYMYSSYDGGCEAEPSSDKKARARNPAAPTLPEQAAPAGSARLFYLELEKPLLYDRTAGLASHSQYCRLKDACGVRFHNICWQA